jgi:hypothetical protein
LDKETVMVSIRGIFASNAKAIGKAGIYFGHEREFFNEGITIVSSVSAEE